MSLNPIYFYESGKSRISAPSIPSGLISYHNFNDNILDSVGSNNGTVTGSAVYVSGISGNAVDIANGERILLNNQSVGGRSAFSISCYFNANASGSNVIYGSWTGTTSLLVWLNGSNFTVFLNTDTATSFNFYTGWSDFNVWKHMVFTYDGALGKMYIDGVKAVSDWSKTGTLTVGTQNEIWGGGGGTSNNFDGAIDGGGIWDKALTQLEVTEIYNIQSAGNELV